MRVLLDANKVITLDRETNMSELRKCVNKRLQSDPEFADNFFEGYESFKVGILLRQEPRGSGNDARRHGPSTSHVTIRDC